MHEPTQPTSGPTNPYVWVGLLIGVALLGLVVWENVGSRHDAVEPSKDVVDLTSANWEREVVQSQAPVVIEFWAPWCGPCRNFAPTFHRLASTYTGRVKFARVNVDDAGEISDKFQVNGIPHVVVLRQGKLAAAPIPGNVLSEARLSKAIDGVLQIQ